MNKVEDLNKVEKYEIARFRYALGEGIVHRDGKENISILECDVINAIVMRNDFDDRGAFHKFLKILWCKETLTK